MSVTVLYLKGATACWMLWRRGRIQQVFNEPITLKMAMQATSVSPLRGIQSHCPWLSRKKLRVRIIIDPVMDQTKTIPAFDYGYTRPVTLLDRLRRFVEQCNAMCRTVACDVLNDDPTRYRRDQLSRYPDALLQWCRPRNFFWFAEPELNSDSWVITESGIPKYVFDWLQALAQQGVEFVDIKPVSSVFAEADADIADVVINVWVEALRCRVMISRFGAVHRVDQWASESEAMGGVEEEVMQWREHSINPHVRIIKPTNDIVQWKERFPDIRCELRVDGLQDGVVSANQSLINMPASCASLPTSGLQRSRRKFLKAFPHSLVKLDTGESFQQLSRVSKWRRRRHEALVATAAVAACSGYFVLLAMMHALHVIELHNRVTHELEELNNRQITIQNSLILLHKNPKFALRSINTLNDIEARLVLNKQDFLRQLSGAIETHTAIVMRSISWRFADEVVWNSNESLGLVHLPELFDIQTNPFSKHTQLDSSVVLLAGDIVASQNQQQASEALMAFLNALAELEPVAGVVPVNSTLSAESVMTLPSDTWHTNDNNSGFVIALRLVV